MTEEKHSKHYYDYNRNDINRPNPFYNADHPSQEFWREDGFSLTGNPAPSSEDIFTLDLSTADRNIVYESPDKGKTVYARKPGQSPSERTLIKSSPDSLRVNNTNANGFWKYEEDKTLKDVEQYLASTYHSHYTSETSKTQTLDLVESIGDAEAFTRSNAIKYLSRFGKKNGKSKRDILKAIHYCILLYHFAGLHKKNSDSDYPY